MQTVLCREIHYDTWLKSLDALTTYRMPRCLWLENAQYGSAEFRAICDANMMSSASTEYISFVVTGSPAYVVHVPAN